MSNRMMTLVGAYAPRQEVYSIDESFLDFDGVRDELGAIGRRMREQVLRWTGLPTSVGFGPTKTLAKLANHVAKTAERRPGVYDPRFAQVCHLGAASPTALRRVFDATEVGSVWGIGRRIAPRLAECGIRTVLELVEADLGALRRRFGVVLERTVLELRGTPCLDVDHDPAARQQIMCSRSFGSAVTDLPELVAVVSQFASRVCEKARDQQSVAGAVQVFLSTSPFRREDRQHSPTMTISFARPTADSPRVIGIVVDALERMYRPGFDYAKAGVMLVDLRAQGHEQRELDLFPGDTTPARIASPGASTLMQALDGLNRRFGRDAVTVASAMRPAGPAGRGASVGRQASRTPRYTTRLAEIATART